MVWPSHHSNSRSKQRHPGSSAAAAAAAAAAPSRRARLPPAAAGPVLVGAGFHPSTPSLPAYPWPGGSYLLARRSSFDFLLCCLFAAYRSAGGWRRGARRGYLLRGARRGTAGRARGFRPASRNAARRVCDYVCSLSIAFCSWLEID